MARKKKEQGERIIIGTKAIPEDSEVYKRIEDVLKALKEKYSEFENVELKAQVESAHILITPPFNIKDSSSILILLLSDSFTTIALDAVVRFNVVGILFEDKLERPEYEELGKLENLLKEAIRYVLYNLKDERELYKPVDWKFPFGESGELERTYMSLFFDPSAKNLLKQLRAVVAKVIESAKRAKRKKKEFDDLRDEARSEDRARKNVKEIFRELREAFKNVHFPSILITGPSGAGKTLIARFIAEKFVKELYGQNVSFNEYFHHLPLVNMDKSTMDVELFGVIEGSYTGAKDSCGAFAKNVGGVVFLDEVGDAPLNVQTKLLAYLDDHKIIPSNYGEEPPHAPTLVIAATNRDVEAMIKSGEFRADLYYRFDFRIRVPGLDQRRQDLRFLISHVLTRESVNPGKKIKKISLRAIERIESLNFSGNFRELENILKLAVEAARADGRNIILERDVVDAILR
ncbi:MAG TPA: hypothetical protein DHV12_01670 [Thermotogae bacterium]|nr:hypothetical protein [Thermotogota bacterium]